MKQLRPIERLIFVFAAKSGLLHAAVDSAKKVLHIKGCALCDITHGVAGERGAWKTCRQELGVPVEYAYVDRMTDALREAVGGQLPCIVAEAAGELTLLIGPDVLERCRGSVPDLRGRLKNHAVMRGLALPA